MAWSLPFLVGFGVMGVVVGVARGVPAVTGPIGVTIVVVGTLAVDR